MKRFFATLIAVLCVFVPLQIAYGQQAEAPVYKDGDWWRVRVKFEHLEWYARSGECFEGYLEYLVEMNQGKPKVYGLTGTNKEAIDCPLISRQLLNIPDERQYLKFPLTVGGSWSHRFLNFIGKWRYYDFNVAAWKKVQTPKGEFDAFKIEAGTVGGDPNRVYYYSPKVKAIVLLKKIKGNTRAVTLVDFKVSE